MTKNRRKLLAAAAVFVVLGAGPALGADQGNKQSVDIVDASLTVLNILVDNVKKYTIELVANMVTAVTSGERAADAAAQAKNAQLNRGHSECTGWLCTTTPNAQASSQKDNNVAEAVAQNGPPGFKKTVVDVHLASDPTKKGEGGAEANLSWNGQVKVSRSAGNVQIQNPSPALRQLRVTDYSDPAFPNGKNITVDQIQFPARNENPSFFLDFGPGSTIFDGGTTDISLGGGGASALFQAKQVWHSLFGEVTGFDGQVTYNGTDAPVFTGDLGAFASQFDVTTVVDHLKSTDELQFPNVKDILIQVSYEDALTLSQPAEGRENCVGEPSGDPCMLVGVSNSVRAAVVPEPSSTALFVVSLPAMLMARRRRPKAIGCAEVRSASIANDAPPSSAHPTQAGKVSVFRQFVHDIRA